MYLEMSFVLVLVHELIGICRFLLIDTHRVDRNSLILNELLQFTKYYDKESD